MLTNFFQPRVMKTLLNDANHKTKSQSLTIIPFPAQKRNILSESMRIYISDCFKKQAVMATKNAEKNKWSRYLSSPDDNEDNNKKIIVGTSIFLVVVTWGSFAFYKYISK